MPQLVSAREVARILGMTQHYVYTLVKNEEIPHLKIGSRLRFDTEAITKWIAARQSTMKKKR